MNGFIKVVLAFIFGALALCLLSGAVVFGLVRLGGGAVASLLDTDPTHITATSGQIADFSLPDGYQPEYSASLLGFSAAAYNPGDGHSHLQLIQSGAGFGQRLLKDALTNVTAGSTSPTARMTVLSKHTLIVRGQDATAVISEGTNHEGQIYRELSLAFQGKRGPALLVLEEPAARWDNARVDQLIASLK